MIIIEGSDGVGKTTLAMNLAMLIAKRAVRELQACYGHMSRPPDDFDHFSGYTDSITARAQDRYHLGAVVYGQMLGQSGCPSPATMRMVQRYLRWQGCLVVVMHADRSWLLEKMRGSAKVEMYSRELILDANDGFRALCYTSNRGEPYHDVSMDVTGSYPDLTRAQSIVDEWWARWGQAS